MENSFIQSIAQYTTKKIVSAMLNNSVNCLLCIIMHTCARLNLYTCIFYVLTRGTLNAINPRSVNQNIKVNLHLINHHIRKLGLCAFNLVKTSNGRHTRKLDLSLTPFRLRFSHSWLFLRSKTVSRRPSASQDSTPVSKPTCSPEVHR